MIEDNLIEFLKTCSDIELIITLKEAREINDQELITAILNELHNRSNLSK